MALLQRCLRCQPALALALRPAHRLLLLRCFSSLPPPTPAPTPAPTPTPSPALAEAQFHALADATLEGLELGMTALEDCGVEGFDLSCAMGVLTLRLGGKGTYVLNKQSPNRQLWWSSPVSGPRRYAWSAGAGRWVNTRDGHDMLQALEAELQQLLGVAVQLAGRAPAR